MKRHILLILSLVLLSCQNIERSYYDSGELRTEKKRINSDSIYYCSFYKNGNIESVGFCIEDSIPIGNWKEYYEDGDLKGEFFYDKGYPAVLFAHEDNYDFSKRDAYIKFYNKEKCNNSQNIILPREFGDTIPFRIYADNIPSDFIEVLYSYQNVTYSRCPYHSSRENSYPYDLILNKRPDTINIVFQYPDKSGNFIIKTSPYTTFTIIAE